MSKQTLNQVIIAQVLHDVRNGQLRHALEMGFLEEDLQLFLNPEAISVLLNTSINWGSIKINREVLVRLLKRVDEGADETIMIDHMLMLGASSMMISEAFGLNHREVAFRKRVLGLEKKQGRWQEITDEQDHKLWRLWSSKVKQYDLDTHDAMDMMNLCMVLAKESDIAMAMIWYAIKRWIKEGNQLCPQPQR